MELNYNDVVTFYLVKASTYRGKKIVVDSSEVEATFIQSTNFQQSQFQEQVTADAIVYPNPDNDFISKYANRLEGMYILANVYGSADTVAWYKVEQCTINRDHLLTNQIDNIYCRLKKTAALPGVS